MAGNEGVYLSVLNWVWMKFPKSRGPARTYASVLVSVICWLSSKKDPREGKRWSANKASAFL